MVTLSVFPNPVMDNLNIDYFGQEAMDIKIEVIDVLGRSVFVKNERTSANQQMNLKLNLQSLVAGMYFVHISNPNKELNSTFKITKSN